MLIYRATIGNSSNRILPHQRENKFEKALFNLSIYMHLDTSYKNNFSGNRLEYLAISRGTRAQIRAATETLWIKLFIKLLPRLYREKEPLHKWMELTIIDFTDRYSSIHIKQPRCYSQCLFQPIRHRRANCWLYSRSYCRRSPMTFLRIKRTINSSD